MRDLKTKEQKFILAVTLLALAIFLTWVFNSSHIN